MLDLHSSTSTTSQFGCRSASLTSSRFPLAGTRSYSRIAPGANHELPRPRPHCHGHARLCVRRGQLTQWWALVAAAARKPSFRPRPEKKKRDKPRVTTAPNHFPPDRGSKQRLLRQTTSQQDIWQAPHAMRRLWLLTARSAARHGF